MQVCWLHSNPRITYLSKLIGMLLFAACLHHESYRRMLYGCCLSGCRCVGCILVNKKPPLELLPVAAWFVTLIVAVSFYYPAPQ
ncbi:hypothetical protein A6J65_000820 [Yersinia enterocolitica]|nr:hypothetical protein A6J65_000820 [Yersinia enterocolitica]